MSTAVRNCLTAMGLCASVLGLEAARSVADELLWASQRNTISGYDLDTGATRTVESGIYAYRLGYDPVDRWLYWTNPTTTGGKGIHRARLDGSDDQIIGVGDVLAIDVANRKLISSRFSGSISVSNLDGSGVSIFQPGFGVQDLAIDPVRQQIFLSDYSLTQTPGKIHRINYDGSGAITLVDSVQRGPVGLAVDPAGALYWNTFDTRVNFTGGVYRASLDGTGAELVWGGFDADSLVLDAIHQRLYFNTLDSSFTLGDVRAVNVDGSDQQVFPLGHITPNGVTVVPEPVSIATVLLIAVLFARPRRILR